jgi:glycerol-3-phosphate O-acyltransferase / dihydroxyacetone phosphate acyltransferase
MNELHRWIRAAVVSLVRLLIGVYFRRIERFHPEQVPERGPILLVSNHPGSLTDAFLIGATARRPVSFVGTIQLFRWKPIAWFLRICGIIPVNRQKDDARAMRSVMDTFEACYRVLEQGGVVGIFPEGITYNDASLRPLKSGAARMALDLEHRHGGKLGLRLVPVGLTYSRKEHYRSVVLVHFGEPIDAARFLDGYDTRRKERVQALSQEIERRIQSLILHLPELDRGRLVRSVARLYLDRLKLGGWVVTEAATPRAEELVLTQAIARVIDHFTQTDPDRVTRFVGRLARYEQRLRRLGLEDEFVDQLGCDHLFPTAIAGHCLLLVVAFPIALFGWAHRWLPALAVQTAVRRLTIRGARKAQTPHVAMMTGLIIFGVAYALYIGAAHILWGWPTSLVYGSSLPVAGLIAHSYAVHLRRLPVGWRTWLVRLRAPFVARSLVRQRQDLIDEIEAARDDYARPGASTS